MVGYACRGNLFKTPIACLRPSEEKLAARASAAARLLFFEALAAYTLPRPG